MNYFDYMAKKIAPKPSHKRLPPSKVVRPAASVTGTGAVRLSVRDVVLPPEPKSEGITVEESTASDSMITRIIGKIRGQ